MRYVCTGSITDIVTGNDPFLGDHQPPTLIFFRDIH